MIDLIGKIREMLHIPKKTRLTYYVDGSFGLNANTGRSTDDPLLTIGAAVTAASAGDRIVVSEDTYDETVSVPAGLAGLEIICEPGTILVNTGGATVISIAAPDVKIKGCRIAQAGQIGLAVTGAHFLGEDIEIVGCTVSFDMDADNPVLNNCISLLHTTTGFDIAEDSGVYNNCFAIGSGATRGFYLSHTNAENNAFNDCHSLNNTAAGYETVAGADENLFSFCSQSSLCAGPTDAGANNTWAHHVEDSQITAGNMVQEDLAAIYTRIGAPAGASVSADVAVLDGIADNIILDTQIRVIQSGAQAILAAATEWLHIDSGTNGAEILSIAIAGINGHDWTLATYVPSADAVAAPAADDKRDTIAYLAAGTEGGLLKPFGIPFNCYLQFTNDGANDQIDQVTITYRSRGVLTLTWGP